MGVCARRRMRELSLFTFVVQHFRVALYKNQNYMMGKLGISCEMNRHANTLHSSHCELHSMVRVDPRFLCNPLKVRITTKFDHSAISSQNPAFIPNFHRKGPFWVKNRFFRPVVEPCCRNLRQILLSWTFAQRLCLTILSGCGDFREISRKSKLFKNSA